MNAIDVPLGTTIKLYGQELLVTRKDFPFLTVQLACDRSWDALAHHVLVLTKGSDRVYDELFNRGEFTSDPPIYINATSVTVNGGVDLDPRHILRLVIAADVNNPRWPAGPLFERLLFDAALRGSVERKLLGGSS